MRRVSFGIGAATSAAIGAVAMRAGSQSAHGGPSRAVLMLLPAHHGLAAGTLCSAKRGRPGTLLQRWQDDSPKGMPSERNEPPGAVRSKPTNTARGTPGNRHFVATTCLWTFYLFVHRAMGCSAPPAFRAPSDFCLVRRRSEVDRGRARRRPNNTGGGALAFAFFVARMSEAKSGISFSRCTAAPGYAALHLTLPPTNTRARPRPGTTPPHTAPSPGPRRARPKSRIA